MIDPRSHSLTSRQAAARILASVALGAAIAAAIVVNGVSASSAGVAVSRPGTAAAQLSALRQAPVDRTAPAEVQAGLAAGSAGADDVRVLGRALGGGDLTLYAAARADGGACHALGASKRGVGTVCVDKLQDGISIAASDTSGWLVYGFAADDVRAVDVIVDGDPQPAQMLANAYALDLGARELGAATALVVHHADGTSSTVKSGLQAPPSA